MTKGTYPRNIILTTRVVTQHCTFVQHYPSNWKAASFFSCKGRIQPSLSQYSLKQLSKRGSEIQKSVRKTNTSFLTLEGAAADPPEEVRWFSKKWREKEEKTLYCCTRTDGSSRSLDTCCPPSFLYFEQLGDRMGAFKALCWALQKFEFTILSLCTGWRTPWATSLQRNFGASGQQWSMCPASWEMRQMLAQNGQQTSIFSLKLKP